VIGLRANGGAPVFELCGRVGRLAFGPRCSGRRRSGHDVRAIEVSMAVAKSPLVAT